MNMRIAAVLLAAVCTAHASTVEFYLTNFNVSALNNIITLIPQGPVTSGNTVISGLPIRIQPTNSFASTNLLTGRYQFLLQGITFPQALYLVVPNDSATYSAASLITNNLTTAGPLKWNFATTNSPSVVSNIMIALSGGGHDKMATNNGTAWGSTFYNPTFADEVGSATINELTVSGAIILDSSGNVIFGTNNAALLTYSGGLLTWRIPMTFTNAAGATVAFQDISTYITTSSQTAVEGYSLPAATNAVYYVELEAVVEGFADTVWARVTYDANGVPTIDSTNSVIGFSTAGTHSPVTLAGPGTYISRLDQVLYVDPIDLDAHTVGTLPLSKLADTNTLAFASQLADYLALTATNDFAAGITNLAWAATQAATNGLGGGEVTAAELISATNLIHQASTNSAKSYADATFTTPAQLAAATNNSAQTWDTELASYQLGNATLTNISGREVVTNNHSAAVTFSNDVTVVGTLTIQSTNATTTVSNLVATGYIAGTIGTTNLVGQVQIANLGTNQPGTAGQALITDAAGAIYWGDVAASSGATWDTTAMVLTISQVATATWDTTEMILTLTY